MISTYTKVTPRFRIDIPKKKGTLISDIYSVSPFVLAATPTLSDITFTPTKEPILSNTVVTESASESPAEDLDDLRREMRLHWGAWGLGVRYIL